MKPDQPTPEERAIAAIRRHTEAHEADVGPNVFGDQRYACGGCLAEIAAEIRAAVEAEREACAAIAKDAEKHSRSVAKKAEAARRPGVAECRYSDAETAKSIASLIRARGKS